MEYKDDPHPEETLERKYKQLIQGEATLEDDETLANESVAQTIQPGLRKVTEEIIAEALAYIKASPLHSPQRQIEYLRKYIQENAYTSKHECEYCRFNSELLELHDIGGADISARLDPEQLVKYQSWKAKRDEFEKRGDAGEEADWLSQDLENICIAGQNEDWEENGILCPVYQEDTCIKDARQMYVEKAKEQLRQLEKGIPKNRKLGEKRYE